MPTERRRQVTDVRALRALANPSGTASSAT